MSLVLFFSLLFICFGILLISLYLGKEYVFAYVSILGSLMAFTITFPLEIFGWPIILAEIFYATFFLATDAVTDNYSKAYAKKLVQGMLAGFIITIVFSKIIIASSNNDLAKHLEDFFTPIPFSLLCLTLVIMFFEQRFDIYIFSKIKKMTGNKKLWLRNCISTLSTQTIDVLLIYPIFFFPIFKEHTWKLMITAFFIKLGMVILDTPFLYMSRKILAKNNIRNQDTVSN